MKFSNQKISLDNHRKMEYGGKSDHHGVLTGIRKLPKLHFDILHQVALELVINSSVSFQISLLGPNLSSSE